MHTELISHRCTQIYTDKEFKKQQDVICVHLCVSVAGTKRVDLWQYERVIRGDNHLPATIVVIHVRAAMSARRGRGMRITRAKTS